LQRKCNEIEQLGENVAALIRIADPPFSKIGSTQERRLASLRDEQRRQDAHQNCPYDR
jgi:hypothetical protein